MKEPTGNEFSEAIGILNAYYRTLVTRLAEEIIERREQFQVPFLGGAEDLVEKYAHPLEQAGICTASYRPWANRCSRKRWRISGRTSTSASPAGPSCGRFGAVARSAAGPGAEPLSRSASE